MSVATVGKLRPLASKSIDFEGLAANRPCGENLLRVRNPQGVLVQPRGLNTVSPMMEETSCAGQFTL
jgi:hypothetical protein